MASSTNIQFIMDNGASWFGRWTTAQAVDTDLHLNKLGVPIDTDSPDMKATRTGRIVDIQAGSAAPTGTIQLLDDGLPTSYIVNVAGYLPTNTGRKPVNIPLFAGHTYRWRTLTAMSAGD